MPLFIIYLLFIFGCVGSSFLCEGFLQLWRAGATLHRDARASHYHGLSCCGAQAPDAQAQQLWLTGLVAPQHVGSSQTRARTRVPCIGRQILNCCATREAHPHFKERKTGAPCGLITSPPLCIPDAIMQWDLLSQICHPFVFPAQRSNQRGIAKQLLWERAPCWHYVLEYCAMLANGADSGSQRAQKLLLLSSVTCLYC